MEHLEIERKYLIRMPDAALLDSLPRSEIEQTYILSPEGAKERVRRRVYADRTEYTHTAKTRVSVLTRIEREEEIDEGLYRELLLRADPSRRSLRKTRYIYEYSGEPYEIDVFPFWDDRALMELELHDVEDAPPLPQGIEIIREVTSDSRYTNSAIAREIPREQI